MDGGRNRLELQSTLKDSRAILTIVRMEVGISIRSLCWSLLHMNVLLGCPQILAGARSMVHWKFMEGCNLTAEGWNPEAQSTELMKPLSLVGPERQ